MESILEECGKRGLKLMYEHRTPAALRQYCRLLNLQHQSDRDLLIKCALCCGVCGVCM